jgi:hypothetical protein
LGDLESYINQKVAEADCVSIFHMLEAPNTDFESSGAIVD